MNLSQLKVLAKELSEDPLNRGYASMNDNQATADINTAYLSQNKTSLSGGELFSATNAADFAGLSDAKKTMWVSFTTSAQVDPFATAVEDFVKWIFGISSTTVQNLLALRVTEYTRATDLNLPTVTKDDVSQARALGA